MFEGPGLLVQLKANAKVLYNRKFAAGKDRKFLCLLKTSVTAGAHSVGGKLLLSHN